jgi:hypothetical protein
MKDIQHTLLLLAFTSMPRRAERWFEEELSKQLNLQELRTVTRGRQLSRVVKEKFETGDYTAPNNSCNSTTPPAVKSSTFGEINVQ